MKLMTKKQKSLKATLTVRTPSQYSCVPLKSHFGSLDLIFLYETKRLDYIIIYSSEQLCDLTWGSYKAWYLIPALSWNVGQII